MSEMTLPIGLPLLVEAMVRVARLEHPAFLPMTRIAPECGAPTRYFEPFLQQMRLDGLLEGLRGPDGGYRLAKAPEDVTVGDIFRSARNYRMRRMGAPSWLDGRLSNWPASPLGETLHKLLEHLDKKMMMQMDSVTLQDLVDETDGVELDGTGLPTGRLAASDGVSGP